MSARQFLTGFLLLFAAHLSSCFEREQPVTPHDAGPVQRDRVDLGDNYPLQIYYDLSEGVVNGSNERMDWDLAIARSDSGLTVWLNSSRAMMAARTGSSNFDTLIQAEDLDFNWDQPSGWPSGAVVGEILKQGKLSREMFVLDMGTRPDASTLGYRKLQFESWEEDTLGLQFADPDLPGVVHHLRISLRDTNRYFQYISLLQKRKAESVSAPKEKWDILFTRHLRIFYVDGDSIPYLVTGVLLNPWNTLAASDSLYSFEEITRELMGEFKFTRARDVIGYNWKRYDLNSNQYSIVPGRNYIIRDAAGYYYKLRFTGYYDENGRKGVPQFEFQQL